MVIPSFHEWLRNHPDEAPAADNLATIIATPGRLASPSTASAGSSGSRRDFAGRAEVAGGDGARQGVDGEWADGLYGGDVSWATGCGSDETTDLYGATKLISLAIVSLWASAQRTNDSPVYAWKLGERPLPKCRSA